MKYYCKLCKREVETEITNKTLKCKDCKERLIAKPESPPEPIKDGVVGYIAKDRHKQPDDYSILDKNKTIEVLDGKVYWTGE